jgi:preprotein translocase subunit SecG
MLITLLLVVHGLLALALVGVILIQRSEGGGLGVGGSPTGLMSARGAADLLTRSTVILAAAFIGTSLLLAILAGYERQPRQIDPNLARPAAAPAPPAAPLPGDPPMFPNTPAGEAVADSAQGKARNGADEVPLAQ